MTAGCPGARRWGLVRKVGVGGVSTSCVCADLQFLGVCSGGVRCAGPGVGCPGARRWGLVRKVGVGGVSTTCVCADLSFWVSAWVVCDAPGQVPEGGGWSGRWGLAGCQPRVFVPTSRFWVSARAVGDAPGPVAGVQVLGFTRFCGHRVKRLLPR